MNEAELAAAIERILDEELYTEQWQTCEGDWCSICGERIASNKIASFVVENLDKIVEATRQVIPSDSD